MKTFEIAFDAVYVPDMQGIPVLSEAPKKIEIQGESFSIDSSGLADYLQVKDEKGKLVFTCNAAGVHYCKRLLSDVPKLSQISSEGVSHG